MSRQNHIAQSTTFHLGYQPGLDGLRGASILCVMANHSLVVGDIVGFLGVNTFFVLSGFLITCLLMEEWGSSGRISLKRFYIRRALRLLPAFLTLLGALLIYGFVTGTFAFQAHEALISLLYFSNWAQAFEIFGRFAVLGHTWSLSIEEQFYLLWPVILLFLVRRKSPQSLLHLVLLGALSLWLVRIVICVGTIVSYPRINFGLDTRADSLLLGCTMGIALSAGLIPKSRWATTFLKCFSISATFGLAAFGFYYSDIPHSIQPSFYNWSMFLISAFAAIIILEVVTSRRGPLQWILNLPILVFVGKVSYGLYLWHYPIFRIVQFQNHWPWWTKTSVAVSLTALATLTSYYFIEKPFLRFKKKYQMTGDLSIAPAAELEDKNAVRLSNST